MTAYNSYYLDHFIVHFDGSCDRDLVRTTDRTDLDVSFISRNFLALVLPETFDTDGGSTVLRRVPNSCPTTVVSSKPKKTTDRLLNRIHTDESATVDATPRM